MEGVYRFLNEVLFIITMLPRAFMRQRGRNCSRWSCETVSQAHQEAATSCVIFNKPAIICMRMQIGQRLIQGTGWLLTCFYYCKTRAIY